MARKLLSANFVDPADADYPKGKTRDKAGAVQGTTGNVALFGDFIQFFQKLIIDSGITENELPDNVSNGYQLIQALDARRKIHPLTTIVTNLTFNVGTYVVAAETYDRNIYVRTDGISMDADYRVSIDMGVLTISNLFFKSSAMIEVPSGQTLTITHLNGADGLLNVYEQKIGI